MKRIFIVEDEFLHLENARILLDELSYDVIGTADDGLEAFDQIDALRPDLVLIDINLNGKDLGFSLGKRIQEQFLIPIIFTTSYTDKERIEKAISIQPVAFLNKPLKKAELLAAILLACNIKPELKNDDIKVEASDLFVKVGNKHIKVALKDITHVQTDTKNYTSIVTIQGNNFAVRSSVQNLIETLNSTQFIQVHRAYGINLNYIASYKESDQSILTTNNCEIPVGKSFKEEFLSKFKIV
jgi:two-component system, LytTR family, response regulator LytT